MATETKVPDGLLDQTNLNGAVGDIDEDPDSPDGNWLTAQSNNADSICIVSFGTPSGDPTVGADLQEFRAWVRVTANASTTSWAIYLRENGSRINGGTAIASGSTASTTGVIISATWNANLLGTADGSLVECEIYFTKTGGSPTNRTTGEVGAVEWNVDYTVGGSTYEDSLSLAAEAAVSDTVAASVEGQASLGGQAGMTTVPLADYSTSASLAAAAGATTTLAATLEDATNLATQAAVTTTGGLLLEHQTSLAASAGYSTALQHELGAALSLAAAVVVAQTPILVAEPGVALAIQAGLTEEGALVLAGAIALDQSLGLAEQAQAAIAPQVTFTANFTVEDGAALGIEAAASLATTTALALAGQIGTGVEIVETIPLAGLSDRRADLAGVADTKPRLSGSMTLRVKLNGRLG
jgi:hypothetical protein